MGISQYNEGKGFEDVWDLYCRRFQILSITIPSGAKWVARGKVFPVKTPFDRVLADEKGRNAFVDLKSVGSGQSFAKSALHDVQVKTLSALHDKGSIAGYVIFFREFHKIIFFDGAQLWNTWTTGESMRIPEGLFLGSLDDMKPSLLFQPRQ